LIVDDEVDITNAVTTGLTRQGFTVDAYNDPIAALAHFRSKSGKFDVVLLDIRMPKMNGLELYREMMKFDDQQRFCFFTAFDVYQREFEKMFHDVTVKAFLKKPISISQLVQRLEDVLNN
jgi:DNA-binding response OmpR family regulator